jgi:hypothetical protein
MIEYLAVIIVMEGKIYLEMRDDAYACDEK